MNTELREEGGGEPTPTPHPSLLSNPAIFEYSSSSVDTASIEKLLLQCITALESNESTLAQQVMWVLHNVSAPNGNPNQRLASFFLKALLNRSCNPNPNPNPNPIPSSTRKPLSVTQLVSYIDLTPWHRFGFSASNSAILIAVQARNKIHIVDLGITHCMQWPTLIDGMAKRPEGPPSLLRITVLPSLRPPVPPLLNSSTEQVGLRLDNFARLGNLPFELHIVNSSNHNPTFLQELGSGLLNRTSLDLRDDETLVINCQNWLRYLPSTTKDEFLESIRGLNPRIVTISDEDADLDSPSLTSRTMSCFSYLWILFDALETQLPKDSWQRAELEADAGEKMVNVIGFEGEKRIERGESGARIGQRMKKAGFRSVGYGEKTVMEVKEMMEGHASGWGLKKEKEEEERLVLTWKGHSSVFTSAWVPHE